MEDKVTGFGWDITLRNPAGVEQPLVGRSDDISQIIDPDTGQMVSGRLASVAIRIGLITIGLPRGIADEAGKPWVVQFDDINGNAYTFAVAQSNPDRALGLVTCILEEYRE